MNSVLLLIDAVFGILVIAMAMAVSVLDVKLTKLERRLRQLDSQMNDPQFKVGTIERRVRDLESRPR
jgi:cell division protein FtsL